MSGGAYNRSYQYVNDMAALLEHQETTTPLRQAFALLLYDVAKAMQAVEWEDSGDLPPEDVEKAIRRAIFFDYTHDLSEFEP